MTISAEFTVNGNNNPATHIVAYSSTVQLELLSYVGASLIEWEIVSCSEPTESIPALLVYGSPNGRFASFVMPSDSSDGLGRSFLVKCKVSSETIDADGVKLVSTKYGVVGAANIRGILPIAAGEENYRHGTHGWGPEINIALKNSSSGSGTGDVVGPVSSVPARVAVFADTTGKGIVDSGYLISDLVGGSGGGSPPPVDLVLTSNHSLSGVSNIDSVTPVAGITRVLATEQAVSSQNGIWLVQSGSWTRPSDFDTDSDVILGSTVYVESGTLGGGTWWQLQSGSTIAGSKSYEQIFGNPDIVIGENNSIVELGHDEGTGTGRARTGSRIKKDISTTISASSTATIWDWDGTALGISSGDIEVFAPNVIAKWSSDSKYFWGSKAALVVHGSPPTIIEKRTQVAMDGAAGANGYLTLDWNLSGNILRLQATNNRASDCSVRVMINYGAFE